MTILIFGAGDVIARSCTTRACRTHQSVSTLVTGQVFQCDLEVFTRALRQGSAISLPLRLLEWPATCIEPGIMGFTRPIENAILRLEADEARAFGSSRRFVMRAQSARKTIPFRATPPPKRGVLLPMPTQAPASNSRGKSSVRFRGNTLEYWPRGYPSHDDL
jgi:hypothetical protein